MPTNLFFYGIRAYSASYYSNSYAYGLLHFPKKACDNSHYFNSYAYGLLHFPKKACDNSHFFNSYAYGLLHFPKKACDNSHFFNSYAHKSNFINYTAYEFPLLYNSIVVVQPYLDRFSLIICQKHFSHANLFNHFFISKYFRLREILFAERKQS